MIKRRSLISLLLYGLVAAAGAVPIVGPVRVQAAQPVYRLGPGDRLRISVFGEEDLSGEFEVNGSGFLSMPLIGEVKAGGLSVQEIGRGIAEKLRQGYLKNPRVNVEVLNYRPFFILGEVNNPGSYPYVNGMTVIEAVALAGGYTYRAKKSGITIRRGGSGSKKPPQVATERTIVLPGDIVKVPERFF